MVGEEMKGIMQRKASMPRDVTVWVKSAGFFAKNGREDHCSKQSPEGGCGY